MKNKILNDLSCYQLIYRAREGCFLVFLGFLLTLGAGCSNLELPRAFDGEFNEVKNGHLITKLKKFQPEVIIVACGFDASGVDPLSRMICSAETFAIMTEQLMSAAKDICQDKVVIAHEGGYSEVHVPFCAHAVLQKLSGSLVDAGDPLGPILDGQQPNRH